MKIACARQSTVASAFVSAETPSDRPTSKLARAQNQAGQSRKAPIAKASPTMPPRSATDRKVE